MNEFPKLTPRQEIEALANNKIRQRIEQERIAAEKACCKTPSDFVLNIKPRVMTNEEVQAREDSERFSKLQSLKSRTNLPIRHKRLDSFQGEEWNRCLAHVSKKLGSGFILALVGGRGTGKTQMAVELIEQSVGALRYARYALAMDFFIKIKATYRKDSNDDEGDILSQFCGPKLLVVDEIQERAESQWEDRLMTHLINRRYNDVKDTLLISNLNKEEFISSVGSSIASRLNETGGIIVCNWKGFRS